MGVKENYLSLVEEIEKICSRVGRSLEEITIVGVTKTVPLEKIKEAYEAGLRHFGENRVQEAKAKIEGATEAGFLRDAIWHMVGHLQRNKVRYAVRLFEYIHSVDSLALVDELEKRLASLKSSPDSESALPALRLKVFVEVKTDPVPTKYGVSFEEVDEIVEYIKGKKHLEVLGLMTVAPRSRSEAEKAFASLRKKAEDLGLKHLSMGMTDDYDIALKEGATFLRIGRRIFGERDY